jgi:alpha-mannosidase
MEVHWLETGSDTTDSPMLRAIFPIQIDNSKFYSQVPFAVAERPVDGKINGKKAPSYLQHSNAYGIKAEEGDGLEVPAQKWVDVTDGKVGLALLNKTKYGHSFTNGDLRITLMRAAGDPDIYPNLGKFNISYSLYPHAGDWKNGIWAEGEDFNVPVYAAEPPSLALVKAHATRPEEDSFFSVDASGVVMTGMKQSEEGNELIIRLSEIEGKETEVNIKVPVEIASARRLNIIELELKNTTPPTWNGKTLKLKIRPNEIVTLGITPLK